MDSFLGAAMGVLHSYGETRSLEELWGLSGLAFRTQVHASLAPAGLFLHKWDQTYAGIMRRLGHDCIAGLRNHFYTEDDLGLLV